MCRHFAFVSPSPVTLSTWLFDVPRSLREQARHPRFQTSGTSNPDGWGVGWYEAGRDVPHRYRTTLPIWDDTTFAAQAAGIETRVALGAARLASPGMPVEVTGNAPFTAGRFLFSHNGFVRGFHHGAADRLQARVSARRAAGVEGHTDSELLFALVLDRLDEGADGREALVETLHDVESIAEGRLNCLLTDGETVWATAWGNSLFRRGHVVASEPLDEDDGWERVDDHSVLQLTASTSVVTGCGR